MEEEHQNSHQKKKVNGKVKKVKVKVVTWSLRTIPTMKLVVFKRDGNQFVRHDELSISGTGLFGTIANLGASIMSVAQPGNELAAKQFGKMIETYKSKSSGIKSAIEILLAQAKALEASGDKDPSVLKQIEKLMSMVKDLEEQMETMQKILANPMKASNAMARSKNGGWDGLVSGTPTNPECAKDLSDESCKRAKVWMAPRSVGVAGLSENASKWCKKRNPKRKITLAVCGVRKDSEMVTLQLRKDAQSVKGWKLFAPLQYTVANYQDASDTPDVMPGLSLGEQEGVAGGSVFWAVQKDGNRSGFARVVKTGPGGSRGRLEPSSLVFRTGDGKNGVRMEEHPQIGVSATPVGLFTAGLQTEGIASDVSQAVGGGIDVGFSLAPYSSFSWGALWLKTRFDIGVTSTSPNGTDSAFDAMRMSGLNVQDINWTMMNFLAGSELKLYLIPRFDFFVSVLGGMSLVSAKASFTSGSALQPNPGLLDAAPSGGEILEKVHRASHRLWPWVAELTLCCTPIGRFVYPLNIDRIYRPSNSLQVKMMKRKKATI